ncbi:MAG: GNAT family N-acetyltransferase [Actinobacteria bacterium]|nr:GNAT family N-acetyltransferase [Actinomycetota bacterium]
MAHPVWPLFDLRVTTPRLELRYIDDELGAQLALLAARGIHDPELMPFALPWTDVPSPQLERNAMQWYWRCRADTSPSRFHLDLAVVLDGAVVGTTGLIAHEFATLREFETGSWLGREFQGRGLGTEMRRATLHLGFAGLGATLATTSAFHDNPASLGVTRRLGYAPNGVVRTVRRGVAADSLRFEMTRTHWEQHLRRDDVGIDGLGDCLALLGL